jgi:Domain of unknown function (DUF309)
MGPIEHQTSMIHNAKARSPQNFDTMKLLEDHEFTMRYFPEKDLPSYIFIPGQNPHPKKSGGHMEGQEDPVAEPIDPTHPEKSDFLRYSVDLYNHGYFWESHVYFEALWNAHGRRGPIADFLKALIKLGAAGVKFNLKQDKLALEHLDRARELLESILKLEGDLFLGFSLSEVLSHPKILQPKWI